MNITSVKLTSDGSSWVRFFEFKPQKDADWDSRGQVFLILSFKNDPANINHFETTKFVRIFYEEYYSTKGKSSFDSLKAATSHLTEAFNSINQETEVSAISLVGNVLYSFASGGAKMKIFRNGMLATILDSSNLDGAKPVSASGFPKEKDVVILGNTTFFQVVPEWKISDSLRDLKMENATASIKSVLSDDKAGGYLISFNSDLSAQESPPLSIMTPPLKLQNPLGFLSRFKPKFEFRPRHPIRISQDPLEENFAERGSRTAQTSGVIILILLVVSIFFGIKQKQNNDQKIKYQAIVEKVQKDLDQAQSIKEVSPAQARTLFLSSQKEINTLIDQKVTDPGILELKKRIDESEGAILGEYKSIAETFLDLSLLSSGFSGDEIVTSGTNSYILDKKGKKLIKIDISTKRSEVVVGPDQLQSVADIAAYEDTAYGLASDGLYRLGNLKKKVVEKSWNENPLIYTYSGNFYVLEKSTGTISRYPGDSLGFGAKQNWMAPGISVDLSNSIDWVIDGSVWVLLSDKTILKFSQGVPRVFKLTDSPAPFTNPRAIYTDKDSKYLYILDPGGTKVFVFDKDGKFTSIYSSEVIKNANGIVVNEDAKKLLILSGSKLYSIELKHL
ncbi:hypothetical protein HY045_03995 [Candidatus Woesebacteria bacterium]|nr:hypothetical protein [Candidatus Woesebacteria bacterium]